MSVKIETVTSPNQKVANFMAGAAQSTVTLTPTHGNTTPWQADVNSWWNGGDVTSETGGWFEGKNGKSHRENLTLGFVEGRYVGPQMVGCSFEYCQNSTAGHGLYLERYGLVWQKQNAPEIFWSSGTLGRRNNYEWQTVTIDFKPMSYVSQTHVFVGLRLQASTYGGSGARTTRLSIRNFQPKWRTLSGSALIIPPYRDYSKRFELNRIA